MTVCPGIGLEALVNVLNRSKWEAVNTLHQAFRDNNELGEGLLLTSNRKKLLLALALFKRDLKWAKRRRALEEQVSQAISPHQVAEATQVCFLIWLPILFSVKASGLKMPCMNLTQISRAKP